MDDVNQSQGAAESTSASVAETTSQNVDLYSEVTTLRAQLSEQNAKFDRLVSALESKSQATEKPVDYNELVKNDIGKAIQLAVKETVGIESQELKKQLAKKTFDEKLEKEFPQVTSDKTFRDLVVSKMNELVSNGGFSKDSPSLAYYAAQMAAPAYKSKTSSTTTSSSSGMNGEAPKSSASTKNPASSDKEFNAWVNIFGIKDKEGMMAKYKAFKGAKQ